MSTKRTIILLLSLAGLILLLIFSLYEVIKVPDVDWNSKHLLKDKDPYGTWVFDQLINERFGQENVFYHYKDTLIHEIDSSDFLYVHISNRRYLDYDLQDTITNFIDQGNEALFISPALMLRNYNEYSYTQTMSSYSFNDSIASFKLEENDFEFQYEHYDGRFDKTEHFTFSTSSAQDTLKFKYLLSVRDSLGIFFEVDEDANLYQHYVPMLFTNHAAKQEFYLDHFNAVFDQFNSKKIIVDHPVFRNSLKDFDHSESPIQFLLQNQSLKWAYFSLLGTVLLFVVFRGKRKQRVIPILEKNKNTSLEYVDTLSKLFENQEQHSKLVPHLKRIFAHHIKKKYYLDIEKENFVALLSRKSKVEEKEISMILNKFKNSDDGYEFNDEQLIALHKQLESFYKNAE